MNAGATAIATAQALAQANALFIGSVSAKRRDRTAPHRTGPNGVFSGWSSNTTSFSYVSARDRDGLVNLR